MVLLAWNSEQAYEVRHVECLDAKENCVNPSPLSYSDAAKLAREMRAHRCCKIAFCSCGDFAHQPYSIPSLY